MRKARARLQIVQLNDFLKLKNVQIVGAQRYSDTEIVLYLVGDGLPANNPANDNNGLLPVYVSLDELPKASEASQAASQDDPIIRYKSSG